MPRDPTATETLRAEFEAVILPHLDGVFRLAMWLVRDRSEAEDVVQETFSQALQSFSRFQRGSNARAWVLTIMRHVRANRNRLELDSRVALRSALREAFENTPTLTPDPRFLRELSGALMAGRPVARRGFGSRTSWLAIAATLLLAASVGWGIGLWRGGRTDSVGSSSVPASAVAALAAHAAGATGHGVFVVSDLEEGELLEIARTLAPVLQAHFAEA